MEKEENKWPGGILPYFAYFTQFTPVIPKFYWDIESQEERILALCKELDKVIQYVGIQTDQININTTDIQKLLADFEKFKKSGFLDYYEQLLLQYVRENGEWIIKSLLGFQVYFGLTEDGHFVAYSPQSWNSMHFDTGAVYGTDNYGRLMLYY